MNRNQYLSNRLREVLLNGKWIANTNFKEQILSINWQVSIVKMDDLNTISALVYHINYYLGGLINVFDGGSLDISDKYSFDVPEILSDLDWNKLVNQFLTNSELFINKIENMEDSKLDQIFVEEKYGTYLRNIEGVIEHSYYHLGQLVILKKLILKNNSI